MHNKRLTFGGAPQINHFKNKIKSTTRGPRQPKNAFITPVDEIDLPQRPIHTPFSPKYSRRNSHAPETRRQSFDIHNQMSEDKLSSHISDVLNYSLEADKTSFVVSDKKNSKTEKATLESLIIPIYDVNEKISLKGHDYNTKKLNDEIQKPPKLSTITNIHYRNGQILRKQREFLSTPQLVDMKKKHEVPPGICIRCRVSNTFLLSFLGQFSSKY